MNNLDFSLQTPAQNDCLVSIITPSFNQVRYVRKTLNSISMQSVQPIEHIIYDGGSTDGTLDILRDYAQKCPNVILEIGKDKGQANAINLGFARARGDVIAWLNTDDWYVSRDVISDVMDFFSKNPGIDLWYGRGDFVSETGEFLREAFINTDSSDLKNRFINSVGILQPALFMRRSVFADIGPLIENMTFAFDYEYWVRAVFSGKKFFFVDKKICEATLHSNSITMSQRDKSIMEGALVVKKYYGFASYQWIDRTADAIVNKVDGIIKKVDHESKDKILKRQEIFMETNASRNNVEKAFGCAHLSASSATVRFIKRELKIDTSRSVLTAFDSKFFEVGITLIAGVHKLHGRMIPLFVYDLGLSNWQRDFLRNLENVFVIDFPRTDFRFPEKYLDSSSYGFKAFANWHIRHILNEGDCALWLDAGIYPLHNLDEIFSLIKAEEIFFVDHDDKSIWPFYNITFASDDLIVGMSATNAELLSPHLRAGIMGYRIGGRYDRLISEAFEYSLDPKILMGEKHPKPPIFINRRVGEASERAINDRSFSNSLSLPQLRELFGYFGHRHDQAIYSILASRHSAPYHSAQRYCLADNVSSSVSKLNWSNGGIASDLMKSYEIPEFYRQSGATTMQHRGTFINFGGLSFAGIDSTRRAVILGNGPSLKGFDFNRFKGLDVFGMNAAYRYWDEINWYPTYYSCLDVVVGVSHKEAIARLIEKSDEYGIRLFLLRDNLIEQLGEIQNAHKVINFDRIRGGYQLLAAPTLSTGSHTAAWAAALGYKEIFLLGIDCNYVEIVDGATRGKGTELEIVEEKPNPNYFFDGYQRKGDKYNIPNPNREIHLESWREVAQLVENSPAVILNANLQSKVDPFDFCRFEDVECHGPVKPIARESVLFEESDPSQQPLCAYPRSKQVTLDETDAIAELFFSSRQSIGNMVDVGAHFGTSLAPFLDQGWTIFAFEPDNQNRTKLLERLAKHKNKHHVSLDTRCVSNKTQKGVSFFTSEQSTGISGLSAFHESHVEAQKVDTTTLTEFFQDKPMLSVDFLKIDTEGHDLFVLQGYPWERDKPTVIECEFEDTKTVPLGYTFHELCHFLTDKGYTVYVSEWYPIIRYGIKHDWRQLMRYPCELADPKGWGNLLAFRDSIDEQALVAAVKKVLKIGAGAPAKPVASAPGQKTIVPVETGKFSFEPGAHFASVGTNQWRYTHSGAKQKLWVAFIHVNGATADREYVGTLRLQADRPMKVNVSIGRHGKTQYEGTSKQVTLQPGVASSIRLTKMFKQDHSSLKLQIEVIDLEGSNCALMTIDEFSLFETLASVRSRVEVASISLRETNRLLRSGDASTALVFYVLLYEQRQLQMYADNALYAARRLGLGTLNSISELRQKVLA